MKKKITMQDIADRLNLSKNSVSQALGNKKGVSEKTKLAVFKMADELGYEYKKEIAREVFKNRFAIIASSFALAQKSFFGEIVTHMKQQLFSQQAELAIFAIGEDEAKKGVLPLGLESKEWTGIFLLSHINTAYSSKVIDLGFPTILIDHHEPHLKADAILTQNKDGAFSAVEYLINQNHRKIGFLGDILFSPSYQERYEGYKQALSFYHIPIDETFAITRIKEEQTALYQALDKMSEFPSAWFCVNSGLGFILNTYLQSKGYTIPQDFSILCFDNTEFTMLSNPPLSTMCTDLHSMSQKAIELMNWRLQNPDSELIHISLAPHLIERESVQIYPS
ncbi:LacI family DNA-binding transcriptional regulator [Listeria costaricensis]|uniref:LacI family DNA-binding transcriptional regulator n=1 Tax=Listeria costaricensis TaxID=2026604 RepID=UPI000C08C947|nr:LacI family DNA-binding transcriptional regulator [Listeria costaricensis]